MTVNIQKFASYDPKGGMIYNTDQDPMFLINPDPTMRSGLFRVILFAGHESYKCLGNNVKMSKL